MSDDHDQWVFAYGSLMWRPGFPHAEAQHARLVGYRRCFCIYSVHHRGSPDRPGLVLGLDRGGTCEGIAYTNTLRHLGELGIRERELERLVAMVGACAVRRAGGGQVSPAAKAMLRAARALPPLVHRRHGKDLDRRFLYRLRVGG
jgi:cation transport protein ChaC